MEAYREIKEITGEEENEKLIDRFIEMEDKNFAMFTCKFMPRLCPCPNLCPMSCPSGSEYCF